MKNKAPVSQSEIFPVGKQVRQANTVLNLKGSLPGENANKGEIANAPVSATDGTNNNQLILGEKIAEGGEGCVYNLIRSSDKKPLEGYVAKVYKREKLTTVKSEKIKLMVQTTSRWASKPNGICFPEAWLTNELGEFVGYLMPKAKGYELGKSIFMPKLLLEKFPQWTRRETVQLCITILDLIEYLNDRNVILGDINAQNILVVSPKEVYFVDCDSYQIADFPCPVGTPNFTPPEAQGKDYKTFLRSQSMENFAIAVLLFMIMLPGKHPYSSVGGESPEKNIRNGNFPYPHSNEDGDHVPRGQWGYIWSHMSFKVRDAFFNTFHKSGDFFSPEMRLSADDWRVRFKGYLHGMQHMVDNDPMAADIFPSRLKMRECSFEGCTNRYVPDEDDYCPFCADHRYLWTPRNKRYSRKQTPYAQSATAQSGSSQSGRSTARSSYTSTQARGGGAAAKTAGGARAASKTSTQATSKIAGYQTSGASKVAQKASTKTKLASQSPFSPKKFLKAENVVGLALTIFFVVLFLPIMCSSDLGSGSSASTYSAKQMTEADKEQQRQETIDLLLEGKNVTKASLYTAIGDPLVPNNSGEGNIGGVYSVGSGENDLPPGLYYFEGAPNDASTIGVFKPSEKVTGLYSLDVGISFLGNYFLELREGDIIMSVLAFDDARFYTPEKINLTQEFPYQSGCYRVGIDIPSGRYRLEGTGETLFDMPTTAYIMDGISPEAVMGAVQVDGDIVEVHEGQYLELYGVELYPE